MTIHVQYKQNKVRSNSLKILAFFVEVGRWSANKKSTITRRLCSLTYEGDKE